MNYSTTRRASWEPPESRTAGGRFAYFAATHLQVMALARSTIGWDESLPVLPVGGTVLQVDKVVPDWAILTTECVGAAPELVTPRLVNSTVP